MAGPQKEMILGVLSVPTWLMPSLLFALAMYGALEAYIALDPHHHPLARHVRRKLFVLVRTVYGVLKPPVKHSWQWLCTDPKPRYWFGLLVFMFLFWLFVMFCFHLDYMFKKMHVLVVQVEYNQDTALSLLGDRYREVFQKSPHTSTLVWGLHIGNGWERVVWPWWTCPFFERFIASFTTQWRYVTDWSAAVWFCGWFGMEALKWYILIEIGSRWLPGNVRVVRDRGNVQDPGTWGRAGLGARAFSPSRRPPVPDPPPPASLPKGVQPCAHCVEGRLCKSGSTRHENKPGGKKLHLETRDDGKLFWPDPKVLCPPAAPFRLGDGADANP